MRYFDPPFDFSLFLVVSNVVEYELELLQPVVCVVLKQIVALETTLNLTFANRIQLINLIQGGDLSVDLFVISDLLFLKESFGKDVDPADNLSSTML